MVFLSLSRDSEAATSSFQILFYSPFVIIFPAQFSASEKESVSYENYYYY
jgi:hypothetical protein